LSAAIIKDNRDTRKIQLDYDQAVLNYTPFVNGNWEEELITTCHHVGEKILRPVIDSFQSPFVCEAFLLKCGDSIDSIHQYINQHHELTPSTSGVIR